MGQGFWDPPPQRRIPGDNILIPLNAALSGSGGPPRLAVASGFPQTSWDADLRSLIVLADYASTNWRERIKVSDPPADDVDQTRHEIEDLIQLARTERASMSEEIAVQDVEFPNYFLALMMMGQKSHPLTYLVLKIAARVAEITMVHFKNKYNRSRPSQLFPALLPQVNPPAHPSYPSGHALMSRLFALCMAEVNPDFRQALMALAARISRNREIAGVHYRSDTEAGVSIADQAFEILKSLPEFQSSVASARTEWHLSR